MEIQQNDKESLAAYIHRFKWEAKRCNFHNNAATIQIFIKGLKNTHNLALTATLLPSSTVNVMFSEEEKCFQCQESGHMACHCPHI